MPLDVDVNMPQSMVLDIAVEIGEADVAVAFNSPLVDVQVQGLGATGPAGASGGIFVYDQNVAASVWTIVHNLGYRPNVATTDTLGRVFLSQVDHIDANSLTVTLGSPGTGHAYLS